MERLSNGVGYTDSQLKMMDVTFKKRMKWMTTAEVLEKFPIFLRHHIDKKFYKAVLLHLQFQYLTIPNPVIKIANLLLELKNGLFLAQSVRCGVIKARRIEAEKERKKKLGWCNNVIGCKLTNHRAMTSQTTTRYAQQSSVVSISCINQRVICSCSNTQASDDGVSSCHIYSEA